MVMSSSGALCSMWPRNLGRHFTALSKTALTVSNVQMKSAVCDNESVCVSLCVCVCVCVCVSQRATTVMRWKLWMVSVRDGSMS